MLLKEETLRGIADGTISLQFRRWKRPTVKSGGTLLTAIGQLAIEDVRRVDPSGISEAEARAAGFADLRSLRSALDRPGSGEVFRIQLSFMGPDPRAALRERLPDAAEVEEIRARLGRLDSRSPHGPWTVATLQAIRDQPGARAAHLAKGLGFDKGRFKSNVRKLKALGLSESLRVGYRLSPRGEEILRSFAVDQTEA